MSIADIMPIALEKAIHKHCGMTVLQDMQQVQCSDKVIKRWIIALSNLVFQSRDYDEIVNMIKVKATATMNSVD